jgi:hypothetical protein
LRGGGVGADTVSVDAPPGRSTVERFLRGAMSKVR